MQTYVFRVVVEPDEDRWMVYCPALDQYAAETWGYTKEEAFKNIQEVLGIILNELEEGGKTPPVTEQLSISMDWGSIHTKICQVQLNPVH